MKNANHHQYPNPYTSTAVALPAQPETAQPYPYVRVILGFALLGGATGGLVLGLFFALLGDAGAALLPVLLMMMTFGAFLGLVPAFLCGLWLAVSRARRNETGLLSAALVGAAISVLYLLVITQEIASMPFGFLGGVAAFLVGLLLLPAPIDAA